MGCVATFGGGFVEVITNFVFFSHRRSGFRNMMNRYGLNVSPSTVPLLIWIGEVVPKWLPWEEVVEFV